MNWIKENVQPYLPDTQNRGIFVGNEVLGGADQGLAEALFGAVKNVYTALNRLQLTNLIEVSTPHSEGVFASSYPPSNGTFKEDVFVYLKPMLDFFSQTGTPFYINVYPFLAYKDDNEHIDINYALFKKSNGIYDAKNDLHYDNMFDAQIDAAYVALIAAGYENMEVRVSETDGSISYDIGFPGLKSSASSSSLFLKVNLVQSGGELTVKTKLHSLIIKDELHGRLSKFPQYLACSVLNDSTRAGGSSYSKIGGVSSAINVTENESLNFAFEEDDCFKDAMQDFLSTPDHSLPSDLISNLVNSRDACEQHIAYSDALSIDKDQVKGKTGEIFYETRDENISDFVSVAFLTRNSESPLYENIDTQLYIRMSALEFFYNRPTLVALIDFGLDLNLVSSRVSSRNDMDIPVSGPTCTGVKEDNGQTLINGLLGYGKGRALFNLTMDVDSVCVFLNKEDEWFM